MRNPEHPVAALHTYIPDAEKLNPAVSTVSTGWHIAHSLLVIIKITEALAHSDPAEYTWKFNLPRVLAFTLNRFPRGRGKAPSSVKPDFSQTPDFEALFAQALQAIETLKCLHPDQFFIHPVFGALNKKNTFIMLDIHTRHHLGIIRDIVSPKG
jgi:hypothetical protein